MEVGFCLRTAHVNVPNSSRTAELTCNAVRGSTGRLLQGMLVHSIDQNFQSHSDAFEIFFLLFVDRAFLSVLAVQSDRA